MALLELMRPNFSGELLKIELKKISRYLGGELKPNKFLTVENLRVSVSFNVG